MCGFAGYKTPQQRSINHEILHALSRILCHRGPDDAGMWISQNHDTALVSRRLSIIDLSSAAAQPMIDSTQSVILSFNGEIYNFMLIKQELESYGVSFVSQSDTEVVLQSYKKWGVSCFEKFDGMFAGAIYDRMLDEIILFRDRMGIKPLYFSLQGGMLSFASEIKALWKMPWIVERISPRGLSHYLTFLSTPAPMTLYDGIYKLPAGYYIRYLKDGTLHATQWYDVIPFSTSHEPGDFSKKSVCVNLVRECLTEAVKKRLLADVPVGALLSGGLDSSLIVALMAGMQANVSTFTVSFEGDPHEERTWARKIAKKFGTDHHELILTEQDAAESFQTVAYHQDEPLGDSVCIPLYYISKVARDAGIKVVLSGEGADELFCGYPMYVDYLSTHRYWKLSQHFMPAVAKKGIYYAARPLYANYPNRQDFIKSWANGRDLFWGGVRVFSESWKHEFLKNHETDPFDPIIESIIQGFPQGFDSYAIADFYRNRFYKAVPDADFFSAMTYIELKHRLPELLLTRTDKMSMAASIEMRVPFMDRKLVEAALQIPVRFKYGQKETKYILKKVAEGIVPHETIYRKKVGFISPVTTWFKHGQYFKKRYQDLVCSNTKWSDYLDKPTLMNLLKKNETSKVDYAPQLWAIQNLLMF